MRLPTALVVQNVPGEDPGKLTRWLLDAGVLASVVTPYDGTPLPADPGEYAGLIVLGGPMSAYDDDHPWLGEIKELFRRAVAAELPTLGICLGSQLLAVALGGRVRPGDDGPEIGPALVAKRDVAAADELFDRVPFTPDVFQWHDDGVVDLPPNSTLLASSPRFPVQAYRVGRTAWGIQFHIETTPEMVRGWVEDNAERLAELDIAPQRILARLEETHADLEEVWKPFTARFAEVVRRADREKSKKS